MNQRIFMIVFKFFIQIFVLVLATNLFSQEIIKKDQYLIGDDGKLQFTVHIWGEVGKPGEYIVSDKTDVLELISKAGGPTEFSNLSEVRITRGLLRVNSSKIKNENSIILRKSDYDDKVVFRINIKKILENKEYIQLLPTLTPGDVIIVGKNNWYRWQTVIRVVSQLAIVAQVWYYWTRN